MASRGVSIIRIFLGKGPDTHHAERKEGMDLGSDNDGDDFGIEVENVIEGRDRGRFVGGKGGKPGFQGSGKPKVSWTTRPLRPVD